ncbi:hypothetical protein IH992_12165 [Candidatus Poribacteria bacterium]|nr:hypothetical protein [Candidatus Poribacteria bacterium]
MNPQWLAVQSFQDSQNLLFAINTLSIHTKLEIAGRPDKKRAKAAAKAKEDLISFLKELEEMVQRAEEVDTLPMLGIDPRRRQLVKNFIAAKRNYRFHSPFLRDKLSRVAPLFHSDKEADFKAILLFLEDLRTLLEEHLENDTEQILGEI